LQFFPYALGVLWSGSTAIPGAKHVIDQLTEQRKAAFFLTNNSTNSRRDYQRKFAKFGIAIQEVPTDRLALSPSCHMVDTAMSK
jgi:ribonucleotide monophosphatase NagD (HAD superfamily)